MPNIAEQTDSKPEPDDVAKVLFFALVGAGATVVTAAPKLVKQARADLVAARFIGEIAVTQGASQLRDRLVGSDDETTTAEPSLRLPRASVSAPVAAGAIASEEGSSEGTAVGAIAATLPSVEELAIPDYDSVPAIDVVMQLADLKKAERSRIEVYELAHRQRRTILGKVEQLRGDA